jgi:diguanylate cyclase
MSSAVSLIQGQAAEADLSPSEMTKYRVGRRRHLLGVEAIGCSLITLVLLIYAYAGTTSIAIPSAYFVCQIGLIGFFAVLSETGFNDRFEDHNLSTFQVSAHVVVQLGFLLLAPEIGFAFLNTLFLIFGFGALTLNSLRSAIAWSITTVGLVSIFLFSNTPIGLPVATQIERFAAMLSFVLTIGQCAFVGLYGSSLRKLLYDRSFELKAANKRIEELAELDDLTGSYNRRCIMRMLADEIDRARRTGKPCSIALIDLDWFKRINDVHGHPTGDEVLRTFAITVFANIRDRDKFGRYGGEEFLLVLPDTENATATRLLNRLRGIIADLDWSAFSSGMRVTISAGVATLMPSDTDDILLARADHALYAAKDRGRNRIAAA